ncbi:hypothetical protein BKK79_20050 [Cupriavidus sp. USMAA2-4]|uniref:hypothetical protein n=1 Tax=Cupriavidus sp. USMAA2-4 TaxID=876364 RepID=UPI0008A6B099|nr:hypothetical protein [Cupriavidus sp. USMAA2-4]AOY93840.1 hypothetical protein BKK79_20050 [Cupriavidus sp. USMAA2-4]
MRLGLGIGPGGRRAGRYDASDLSAGTLSLDFLGVNQPTLVLDFLMQSYQAWTDDPTWLYGTTGVFKIKG